MTNKPFLFQDAVKQIAKDSYANIPSFVKQDKKETNKELSEWMKKYGKR